MRQATSAPALSTYQDTNHVRSRAHQHLSSTLHHAIISNCSSGRCMKCASSSWCARRNTFDLCAVCGDFIPRPAGWKLESETEEQLAAEEGEMSATLGEEPRLARSRAEQGGTLFFVCLCMHGGGNLFCCVGTIRSLFPYYLSTTVPPLLTHMS